MHAMLNLEGPQYSSFVAASSVGIMDTTLQLSPEKRWLSVVSLSIDIVIGGLGRDEDSNTFLTWRKTIIHATWSCADRRMKDEVSCIEVELRRVSKLHCSNRGWTCRLYAISFPTSLKNMQCSRSESPGCMIIIYIFNPHYLLMPHMLMLLMPTGSIDRDTHRAFQASACSSPYLRGFYGKSPGLHPRYRPPRGENSSRRSTKGENGPLLLVMKSRFERWCTLN